MGNSADGSAKLAFYLSKALWEHMVAVWALRQRRGMLGLDFWG